MITDIDFVGFEVELQKIKESLVDGPKELDVVSLVGMPGNGKTTLAQKLYQDPSVRLHFDIRVWCTVSQLYQKKEVWHTILHQLDYYSKMVDGDYMAERIAQKLKKRRYLIIIDDIWDLKPWNDLRKYLPNDNNGSRILMTTRHHDVAKQSSSVANNVNNLRLFTERESYELFERKAGLKDFHSVEDLLRVGHQIALSCKGLPLAIAIVARHLAKVEKNVEEWEKFLASLSSHILNDTERPYREMLEWSYNCLPDHLKPCFLYAGVLGAYKPVPVWKLKLLWIAEGFVCDNKFETLDKQAEDYLKDLIDRSLVIPTKERAIGGVKEFRMHDLLKDFCLELSEELNFMHKMKNVSWPQPFDSEDLIHETDGSHKFSIWSRGCNFQIEESSGKSCGSGHAVRSILMHPSGSFVKDDLHDAIDSMDFELLQVIDLSEEVQIDDIIERIKLLNHLKYLAGGGSFSLSIASFRSLQSLIFDNYGHYDVNAPDSKWGENLRIRNYGGVSVPDCIWDMENLRNVQVRGGGLARFQVESSRLEKPSSFPKNIETFSTPYFTSESDEKILRRMPMLRKLSFIYGHGPESKFPNLDFLTHLVSLKVSGRSRIKGPVKLYNFNFPSNLKKLTLLYFKMSWDNISKHGRELPNLEVLKLELTGYGRRWTVMAGDFPNLRYLKLGGNFRIKKLLATEESFPKLEQLYLERVTKLEELPCCFEDAVCLQVIILDYCQNTLCDSARRIEKAQKEEMLNEEFVVDVRGLMPDSCSYNGHAFFSGSTYLTYALKNRPININPTISMYCIHVG